MSLRWITSFIFELRIAQFKNTHNFMLAMLRFPNCKINIGLYITNRRADGYHDLETVFYPVALKDALEIVPAKEASIQITGLEVAGNREDNLVWKAYSMLKGAFPERVPELAIFLHKAIPMGAGLGGGSADGAFMLQLVNDHCNLGLNKEELAKMALQLGSDCPFFIYNTPQFAKGRGEQMEAMQINLSDYSIQLICPQVHVSTAKAFQMIRPRPAAYDLKELPGLPLKEWKDRVINDFEEPVFAQHPELANIKDQLYQQGAIYASMSGSGSAIYGIFEMGRKATFDNRIVQSIV
jgi:4-diphosphocytidyl-2-C-methyl-D-erythritol kinase